MNKQNGSIAKANQSTYQEISKDSEGNSELTGEGKGKIGDDLNFTCIEIEVYSVQFAGSSLHQPKAQLKNLCSDDYMSILVAENESGEVSEE